MFISKRFLSSSLDNEQVNYHPLPSFISKYSTQKKNLSFYIDSLSFSDAAATLPDRQASAFFCTLSAVRSSVLSPSVQNVLLAACPFPLLEKQQSQVITASE